MALGSQFAYEADGKDLRFLEGLRASRLVPAEVPFEALVSSFEALVSRFERREIEHFLRQTAELSAKPCFGKKSVSRQRFSLFMLWDASSAALGFAAQTRVFAHWRRRQVALRRPLLRAFWKVAGLPFSGFGRQDPRKSAFEPRRNKKKKTRLGSRGLKGGSLLRSLRGLRREMRLLLALVRMVTARERLKLRLRELDFWGLRSDRRVASPGRGPRRLRPGSPARGRAFRGAG